MKPKRLRKNDRITNQGATRQEIEIDFCLGAFDQRSREMDAKWGVDRLPDLVTPELADIWGRTMANLNEAILNGYAAEDTAQAKADVLACVASALRGFDAMDRHAEASGAPKSNPDVFEIQTDQGNIAIIKDPESWPALKAARPDLVFFTPQEVANALEAYRVTTDFVEETTKHFPKAEIKGLTQKQFNDGGDPISF